MDFDTKNIAKYFTICFLICISFLISLTKFLFSSNGGIYFLDIYLALLLV